MKRKWKCWPAAAEHYSIGMGGFDFDCGDVLLVAAMETALKK